MTMSPPPVLPPEFNQAVADRQSKFDWSSWGSSDRFGQLALILFAVVVIVNSVVLGWFAISVNGKLNAAIELTKPQTGTLTMIMPTECSSCGDLTTEKQALLGQKVVADADRRIDASSGEAQTMIQQFGITKLPAMVFVADQMIRSELPQALKSTGVRPSGEQTLVWEKTMPPYVDVATDAIAGLVTVTYLTDQSCQDCYDVVATQGGILRRFGMAIGSEQKLDIASAEGQAMMEQYQITQLPTILLSAEAGRYESLMKVWPEVGSREADGNYVFRMMDALGVPYKDMSTGRVVSPPAS